MNELSHEAQQALGSFQRVHQKTPEDQAQALRRLARGLAEDQAASVVTPAFRRRRALKVNTRLLLRAVATGVLAFGAIWFVDRELPRIGSNEMLDDARELIREGKNQAAVKVLAGHARTYRTRAFAEDRMGLVADALCGLRLTIRARKELEGYVEVVPESRHAKRLTNPCAGIPRRNEK